MGYNDESAADKRKRWEQAFEQGRQKSAQGNRYKQYMDEHFGVTEQQRKQAYQASGMDLLRQDLKTLDNDLRTKPMMAQRGRVSGMLSALQKQRTYFQKYADYFTPEELSGFDSELRRHEELLTGTLTDMEVRAAHAQQTQAQQSQQQQRQPATVQQRAQTGAALGAPMGRVEMPVDQTQRKQLGILTPQEQRTQARRGMELRKTYGDSYDVEQAAKKKEEAEIEARKLYERKKAYVEKRETAGWNSQQEKEKAYRELEYLSKRLGAAQAEKMRFSAIQKEYGEKTMEGMTSRMQAVGKEIAASQKRVEQLQQERKKAEIPGGRRDGNEWVPFPVDTEKIAEIDKEIKNEERKQKILEGQQNRIVQDWQTAYFYKFSVLQNREDFAEKSRYESNGDTGKYLAMAASETQRNRLLEMDNGRIFYDYVNGNADAVKALDTSDRFAVENHTMWKDLPEETVRIFNYLYTTEGKDAALEYLNMTVSPEYTWLQSLNRGIASGTGLASISGAISTGMASLFGGEDDKKNAVMSYRQWQQDTAGAAQQHPVLYYAGSTVGNLGLMAATGGVAGKVVGGAAGAASGALGARVATGALSFATAQAIRDMGEVATGGITAGEYGKNIIVSGIQGAAGNLASELVSSGIANRLIEKNLMTPFMEWMRNTASGVTFATVNQAIGYLAADEKPTAGEIVTGLLSSFAFSLLDGGLRTLRTTRAAKQQLEQMVNSVKDQYNALTNNSERLTKEQAAERVAGIYQYTQDVRAKLDGTYLAGQQETVDQMHGALDFVSDWAYNWIAENTNGAAPTGGQTAPSGGMLALPETAGQGQTEPMVPTQPVTGGAPEQTQRTPEQEPEQPQEQVRRVQETQKAQVEVEDWLTGSVPEQTQKPQYSQKELDEFEAWLLGGASEQTRPTQQAQQAQELQQEIAQAMTEGLTGNTEAAASEATSAGLDSGKPEAGNVAEIDNGKPEADTAAGIEAGAAEADNTLPGAQQTRPAQDIRKEDRNGTRTERLSDRNGGRLAGAGTGGQAGSLGGSRPQGAAQQSRAAIQRQNTARSLRLQKISSKELGLAQGTDEKNLQIFPVGAWDDEIKQTVKELEEETGKHVTVVLGTTQIRTKAGIKKVRGYNNGKEIVVQADNYYATVKQIADHELAHDRLKQNPGLAREIEREIRQDYPEGEFDRAVDAYIGRLRGVVDFEEGMSTREYDEALQRVKDEILCDAYAGINSFGAHAEKFQEQTQRVMQRRGIGRKSKENAAALARRGVGDDGERYSIQEVVGKKKDYGKGVLLDTNLFDGVKPREWGNVLGQHVYKNMAGREVTMYDEQGNPETVYFARDKDRVKKDGVERNHRVINKLARYQGNNIRALATVHLSEALATSKETSSNQEHNHQWMDENGWEFRTVYLEDKHGNIYEATLNIANGRDRKILYDISNIRLIDKKGTARGNVSSTTNGRDEHTKGSSNGMVAQGNENVKEVFSLDEENDAEYLSLAERFREGTASEEDTKRLQEMVDAAAEEALKDSKVRLDEDGKFWGDGDGSLLKVYHATDADFTVFDREKLGTATDGNAADALLAATAHVGHWFNTADLKDRIRAKRSVGAYLDIRRPYMAGTVHGLTSDIADYTGAEPGEDWDYEGYTPEEVVQGFLNHIQWDGYDGVALSDEEFGGMSFVALDADQIKSADPVTYDSDGKIIPLSERFRRDRVGDDAWKNDDIRFSADEEEPAAELEEKPKKKKKNQPVAESLPIIAKRDLKQNMLNLFSIPQGMRADLGVYVDHMADKIVKNGALTQEERDAFFDRMYSSGVMEVAADEYYQTARQDIVGRRIYVPEEVKHEFGDDWNQFRRNAFSAGVLLTNQRSDNAIDTLNMELAENLPGLFNADETDSRTILERIVQMADEGRSEQMSLNEYAAWLAGQDYVSEDEVLDNIERQMDWALRTFAEKAGLEIRLRDRTGVKIAQEREKTANARMKAAEQRGRFADREQELKDHFYDRERKIREREKLKWAEYRQQRKEMNRQDRERRELRELQQRTLKQLQWLSKNQQRAPEELRAAWNEVLSDIDIYAVGAANAMNWSNKYNATWENLAEMYKAAKESDPNFLPSKELERIVARVDYRKIEDMDLGALQDLYKAAIGLRTEFYNRNNVIGDEYNRMFEEVYEDSKRELMASGETKGAKATRDGKKISKFLNQDQLSPMNVMQRMGGWNPNGTFYSMARQLEKGERDIRAYTVRANKELENVLTEYADFVRRADGQGKDAIWYEVEIPELLGLELGSAPTFGETVTVYMTPSQKIHLYLESKNYENLRHMEGGRTFPDKKLYSEGKRREAFAQGKTIRLAPETVKALVSNLTPEEQAIADALERYYNQFAKREINRVSNLLYGYDKAVSKNYTPIYTNTNYTKSEMGVYNATAEGVGNLKQRQYSKNPSYNIGAFDAFERHVEQTARFVGMAVPARNWQTLLNWRESNDSMADVITHNWGDESLRYIQDLVTSLQAGNDGKSDTVSAGVERFFSNYISAVFGANPSIVLKQLGSIPLAGVWLDFKNIPSVGQIRKIDRDLIGKYTQELAWRTMGYSTPETKQLKENPNWTQRNKTVQFALGGGAITAMDGWAASVLWPWAENKVRRENPELEVGTQEEIESGSSKFYKKAAEVFNEAVARSQSTSDEMHQGTLRKSKNPVTRAFTMFKSDASQTYNAWRQTAGEARYYRESGDEAAARKAKRRVGIAFLAATGGYLWAQGIALLMNLWKHKGKAYRNDDGELTFGSVAEEMALGLAGDLAGVIAGGEEVTDILGNILTGEKWYGIDTPGMEQMNDVIETIITQSKGAFDGLKDIADVIANGGNPLEYLRRNAGDITGGMKELAETIATYVPGISVGNLESYLLGTVRWVSPELATAYEDALQTSTKGDLKGLTGDALAQRVDSIFSTRQVELDADAADAVAALYEAGFTGVVPVDTPSSINVGDESRELGAYQQQVYDKVWSSTVNDTMQALLASDEFAEASDAAKEKMLKALYSYAGEQAKAVLFEDYTADTAKADAVLKAGASMAEWLTWVGQSGTLEPETGKESVSATQKYKLLRNMDYSDKVKFAIAGSVMGTEMKTDNGTKSQYAKMLDIQKGGLSADQYLNLRIEGAVDKYLKQKEAGASNSTAYQMAMALDKLPEDTKPVEKWRTAIKTGGSQKEQLAALKGVMTEAQYDKVEIATYYNIKPDTWVKLNEMMPEFDEDGNGSYKKGEIENAIDALGDRDSSLASAQKAVLWQLMTGSTSAKNNPYNTVVAQEIIDERSKRKADREESKKKTK